MSYSTKRFFLGKYGPLKGPVRNFANGADLDPYALGDKIKHEYRKQYLIGRAKKNQKRRLKKSIFQKVMNFFTNS